MAFEAGGVLRRVVAMDSPWSPAAIRIWTCSAVRFRACAATGVPHPGGGYCSLRKQLTTLYKSYIDSYIQIDDSDKIKKCNHLFNTSVCTKVYKKNGYADVSGSGRGGSPR